MRGVADLELRLESEQQRLDARQLDVVGSRFTAEIELSLPAPMGQRLQLAGLGRFGLLAGGAGGAVPIGWRRASLSSSAGRTARRRCRCG